MSKVLGYLLGIGVVIFIVMLVFAIALWILNFALVILGWVALIATIYFVIKSLVNYYKGKKDKTVKSFIYYLKLAIIALVIFGISHFLQPKLHNYLVTAGNQEESSENDDSAKEENEREATEKIKEDKLSEDEKNIEEAEVRKEEELREKEEAEAAKKEEELALLAEAKEKEPISKDFSSFDDPYDTMTDLQREDFWEKVKGKYVEWTGEVVEVADSSVMIKSENDTLLDDFVVKVNDSQKEKLININLGDTLTVYGKLTAKEGIILSWQLSEGEIK